MPQNTRSIPNPDLQGVFQKEYKSCLNYGLNMNMDEIKFPKPTTRPNNNA